MLALSTMLCCVGMCRFDLIAQDASAVVAPGQRLPGDLYFGRWYTPRPQPPWSSAGLWKTHDSKKDSGHPRLHYDLLNVV